MPTTLTHGLLYHRQRINRERSLPATYRQLRDTGRLEALRLTWKPGQTPVPHIFWDSDVAKWLEAAAYSLARHPDPVLEAQVDEIIAWLQAAQQPDGYLNSHFVAVEPGRRWTNLRDKHEMYCAGHLIEAAAAHFQATGKHSLLDVLCRYADHIDRAFGPNPGQMRGYCGHEEIELALVKLYRATGERRYLRLSQYFVDERGRQPHYFDQEARARGEDPATFWAGTYAYNQAHLPVREQTEVVGHAVRAMYLYSAMADLARETGDLSLKAAGERLWRHLASRRLYLTGGIGPSGSNEGFTSDYDLPDENAYAETCAAIGLVFWNRRLLQLELEARCADLMERALYNGVLAGVSLDGERFFYENPLASLGNHHRQEWYACACCPPNLARLLACVDEYVCDADERGLSVHLYAASESRFEVDGQSVLLRQVTDYPWDGRVKLEIESGRPVKFELRLRLPGWCRAPRLSVQGTTVELGAVTRGGYACLERLWQPGTRLELELPMPVERMHAHPDVRAVQGRVALQRGPLVYCLEQADNAGPIMRLRLPAGDLRAVWEPEMLGGVVAVRGQALAGSADDWGETLYRPAAARLGPTSFTAIPYFAWDNRAPGPMRVWLPEARAS